MNSLMGFQYGYTDVWKKVLPAKMKFFQNLGKNEGEGSEGDCISSLWYFFQIKINFFSNSRNSSLSTTFLITQIPFQVVLGA